MTKASDNAFPSLLLNETTAPSAPAASKRRLYVDSSHILRWIDSASLDSPLAALNKWNATTAPAVTDGSGAGYAVGSRWIDATNHKEYVCLDATVGAAVWTETTAAGGGGSGSITASGYTQNTARLLGRTTASAGAIEEMTVGSGLSLSAGSLTATGGTFNPDVNMPWLIDVDVFMTPVANTNWNVISDPVSGSGVTIYNGQMNSNASQNAAITWNVVLAAGTWTVELLHRAWTDRGIYSVQFDTVEKGTIDGYNATDAPSTRSSVTGISVPTTAKIALTLKMATKNVSASNYRGSIQHIQLRRTA